MWSGEEGVLWWANKLVRSLTRDHRLSLTFHLNPPHPTLTHSTAPRDLRQRSSQLTPLSSTDGPSCPLFVPCCVQAYASVFVLIGAWIVFRFIGPASGLYELKAGFTEVPTSIN